VSEVLVATTCEHHILTALGLLAEGREEYVSFGAVSLSSLFSVTPETLLQIGSLSKIFTATAVRRLIACGALPCKALTRVHLPNLTLAGALRGARVTVAHVG
jgi:CubicO group peptidase (beta-lactamase class C family)